MIPIIRPVFTVTMFEDKSIVSAEIPSIDISERPCYYEDDIRITQAAEMNALEIADFLGITTVYWMMQSYINPLIEKGMLKMTKPDVPKSKNQKYFSVSNTE
ncbi:Fic family protein [Petrocella sp. FN5]|uniref:Fic family protein n=1 Tax=Petrocella sp. FN5 TaxID=3032002 RepID=UPI0023DCA7F4|nr:hypothetical protein [Petrocella sp. FN5]MDF1618318.1 hypothetical protein [Petrocella sp. FN5]